MNLGVTYLQTFVLLCLLGSLIALPIAIFLARTSRRRSVGFIAFLVSSIAIGGCVVFFFQQSAFERLHQWQNRLAPKDAACLEYQPTFMDLHARYRMTPDEFNEWIADYPMRLSPMTSTHRWDEEAWNVTLTGPRFETKAAENGKQLRIYYQDGIAYLSYNAW